MILRSSLRESNNRLPSDGEEQDVVVRDTDGGVKRPALVGAIIGILGLDWAALDDIFTGSDPSMWVEGLVLVASIPVIGILVKHLRHKSRES